MNIQLKKLESDGYTTDEILDYIFNQIDGYQILNMFDKVDDILENIDVENINIDNILGFLTVTYPYKNKYKNREDFHNKVISFLENTESEDIMNIIKTF